MGNFQEVSSLLEIVGEPLDTLKLTPRRPKGLNTKALYFSVAICVSSKGGSLQSCFQMFKD